MRISLIIALILFGGSLFCQAPSNDNCVNAIELCSDQSVTSTNQGATIDVCSGCADGTSATGNFCYSLDNTIWFSFTTNALGGDATVDLSGLNCLVNSGQASAIQGVIIEASSPCDESTYNLVSNCNSSATTLSLSSVGLNANTTYYVQIDGDLSGGNTIPAECSFDIVVTGSAVDPTDQVTLTSSDTDVCESETVVLNADAPDCSDVQSYIWYSNGIQITSTTTSTLNFQAVSDVTLSVDVVCNETCNEPVSSNSVNLSVEEVDVYAGPDYVITSGESVTLTGTGSGALTWAPNNSLSTSTGPSTVASPTETTVYFLTTTSVNGCQETDEVIVVVNPPIIVPNIVTPNEDGINDTWVILGIERYQSATVSIYDRWGQRIFNSTGYGSSEVWDGTYAGKALPPSTYYYHIDLKTGDSDFDLVQGFIELIY